MCPRVEKHSSSLIPCWKELLHQDFALSLKHYHLLLLKQEGDCLCLDTPVLLYSKLQILSKEDGTGLSSEVFHPQKPWLMLMFMSQHHAHSCVTET